MATDRRPCDAAARRVLFLHGAGAWGGQWAIWRRVFEAEGWQVAAPDRSPAAGGLATTRFEHYVAQSMAAFEALADSRPDTESRPPPVVVGASLGALLAFALAGRLDAAGRSPPAALVLLNPLPPAPWAASLPRRSLDGDVRPWQSQGRFDSTARALPGAAFSDQQFAYRGWRDESTAVLREAQAGLDVPTPRKPCLVIASDDDADVPPAVSTAFAVGVGADLLRVPGGHVAPVMGASAAHAARLALAWLDATLSRP